MILVSCCHEVKTAPREEWPYVHDAVTESYDLYVLYG